MSNKQMFGEHNNGIINDNFSNHEDNVDGLTISLNDINSLNVIINDNDCSNYFMQSICCGLDDLGIKYKYSNHEENIPSSNCVVITLDQQYVSGPKLCIMAPYSNVNSNNSDALALALDTSFRGMGINTNGVVCGRRGFRSENKASDSMRIPTPTEEAVSKMMYSNVSFATIAFGTELPSAQVVCDAFKDGLARYATYVSNKNKTDLVYRAEGWDNLDGLARKFGCTVPEISKLNNLGNNILVDDAIINPSGYSSIIFDDTVSINVLEDTIKRKI